MNNFLILIVMGLALSMDAFAVSLCNGLSYQNIKKSQMLTSSFVFGIMQGVMPVIGFYLGFLFLNHIEKYLPWISFAVLLVIGFKMILESVFGKQECSCDNKYNFKTVLLQGVATSIDALAVGITLLNFSIGIYICAPIIAIITFAVCFLAAYMGFKFGKLIKGKNIAQILGGIVLILIGISFLLR